MTTMQVQKKEFPQRSHLQLIRVERTPEQHFDLELAESLNALVPPREPRPRRLTKLAAGELFPGRVLARVVDDVFEWDGWDVDPMAVLRALWAPIRNLIERKARRRLPRRRDDKLLPAG